MSWLQPRKPQKHSSINLYIWLLARLISCHLICSNPSPVSNLISIAISIPIPIPAVLAKFLMNWGRNQGNNSGITAPSADKCILAEERDVCVLPPAITFIIFRSARKKDFLIFHFVVLFLFGCDVRVMCVCGFSPSPSCLFVQIEKRSQAVLIPSPISKIELCGKGRAKNIYIKWNFFVIIQKSRLDSNQDKCRCSWHTIPVEKA